MASQSLERLWDSGPTEDLGGPHFDQSQEDPAVLQAVLQVEQHSASKKRPADTADERPADTTQHLKRHMSVHSLPDVSAPVEPRSSPFSLQAIPEQQEQPCATGGGPCGLARHLDRLRELQHGSAGRSEQPGGDGELREQSEDADEMLAEERAEEAAVCSRCGLAEAATGASMLQCAICRTAVHADCFYGTADNCIEIGPEWCCDVCHSPQAKQGVSCALCKVSMAPDSTFGAMWRVNGGREVEWLHLVCADLVLGHCHAKVCCQKCGGWHLQSQACTPRVCSRSVFETTNIENLRKIACRMCSRSGGTIHTCSNSGCQSEYKYFHPWCALQVGCRPLQPLEDADKVKQYCPICWASEKQRHAEQMERLADQADQFLTDSCEQNSSQLSIGSQKLWASHSLGVNPSDWGEQLPEFVLSEPISLSQIAHIDLCAGGAAGFSRAASRVGVETKFFAEVDEECREVFQASFGEARALGEDAASRTVTGDIFDIHPDDDGLTEALRHSFGLLTCGFPCPDFSTMGIGQGINNVKRGQVVFRVIKLMDHLKVPVAVLENVTGLLYRGYNKESGDGKVLSKIVGRLKSAGYFSEVVLLNSMWIGVPQNRPRVYIVCFRSQEFWQKFRQELRPNGLIGSSMRCKTGRSLVRILEAPEAIGKRYYISKKSMNAWTRAESEGKYSHTVHSRGSQRPAGCLLHSYGSRGFQGAYVCEAPQEREERGLLQLAQYSSYSHPADDSMSSVRALIIRESYRLQGFRPHEHMDTRGILCDKNFEYKALGNAVTVPVAEVLLQAVLKSCGVELDKNLKTMTDLEQVTKGDVRYTTFG